MPTEPKSGLFARLATGPDGAYLRRGTLTLAGVTIGGYLCNYALNIALTHNLSPHEYGDFKVAFSYAFLFGAAVLLGGDRAAPMVLAPCLERGEPRRVGEFLRFYLGNAWLLALGLAVVTWLASWLHTGSPDPQHHHPLAWAVLAVPLNAAGAMVSRTVQAAKRPGQASVPWRIGLPALQLVLIGLLIAAGGTLRVQEAIAASTAATLCAAGTATVLARRRHPWSLSPEPSEPG